MPSSKEHQPACPFLRSCLPRPRQVPRNNKRLLQGVPLRTLLGPLQTLLRPQLRPLVRTLRPLLCPLRPLLAPLRTLLCPRLRPVACY